MDLKQIRVETADSVSHYSTKYFHVEYNNDLRSDELKLSSINKPMALVVALHTSGTIITYSETIKL